MRKHALMEESSMKRSIALLLAVLTLTGTLTLPALAAGPDGEEGAAQGAAQEETSAQEGGAGQETSQPEPDPDGTVSWANLDSRIREGSLSALILSESITSLENLDYDQMYENLRKQINSIATVQWYITMMGGDSSSLDQAYDSLRDTFEDLKDGVTQEENADLIWQLEDTVNQVVAGGETVYLTLLDLEQQAEDGQRGLETIDRNLEQLRLRQQLGQVSRQTVAELEQTRSQTASQLSVLDASIRQLKRQLETMLGVTPTGEIALAPLPQMDESQWENRDYEADLAAAKAASWTLRDAQNTLDDAKETWDDAQKDYRGPDEGYLLQMAKHTWNAAQLTYNSTVETFETSFRTLYDALATSEVTLASAQSALAWQQTLLSTAEQKYALGLSSQSAVLDAQDDVASAQSTLDSAWRDLFSARNSYRWAVEYGLIQGS